MFPIDYQEYQILILFLNLYRLIIHLFLQFFQHLFNLLIMPPTLPFRILISLFDIIFQSIYHLHQAFHFQFFLFRLFISIYNF